MALQKAIAAIGVAIQSAKGTPQAQPAFMHGVVSGTLFDVDISHDRAPIATGTRVAPGVDRTLSVAKFDATFRAHSKSIGAWLYGGFGGKSVSGSGPYVHTISPAAALPYLTVFANVAGEIKAIQDVVIDSLEVTWNENSIVEVNVSGMGTIINLAATMTPTVDDSFATYMTAASGAAANFKYAASGAAAQAPIKSGSFKVSNNVDVVELAYSIVPDEVYWGRQDYECALVVVPTTTFNDWRTVVTGSAGGTAPQAAPVYGGLDVKFVNGSDSLQIAATRVPFLVGHPQPDPSGGNHELALAGIPVLTAAGAAAVTTTLTNGQVSY